MNAERDLALVAQKRTNGCSPLRRSTSHDAWAAAALVLVWLMATAWARPLSQPDEGRYVGIAWEMLRSGDWLTPTLNGLPFLHKPPLFYWITAASMSLLGPNEFAARVAPILGASLGAFALYVFTRRWAGAGVAHLTLFALLVQPLFYIGGQFANLDMLVTGCIGATILLLAHSALCVDHLPHRGALAGAYAMAALGALAKGLIGAVLPALVICTWLATMRRWRLARSLASPTGMVLFALIAAPWFIAMQQRFADFTNYFFIVERFKRFTMGGFNNVEPFWFYTAVLLLFSLPCLPWLYISVTRRRGPIVPLRDPLRMLMWVWVAVVIAFFSIPQSKPLGYVLSAVPPLAFLMADGFLAFRSTSARSVRMWWASLAVMMLLSVGAIGWYTFHPLPTISQGRCDSSTLVANPRIG